MKSPAPQIPDPDIELVERWCAGDRVAGDQIIRRYFPPLRRFFVTRITDAETREDLIQDTFHAVLVAAPSFEKRSSFKSFLFGIARNKLVEHVRRHCRVGRAFDPMSDSFEDLMGRSPSSLAALHEDSQRLAQAMADLPVDEQLLLELRYWEGMSGPELAEVFGVEAPAIRARLFRARRKLAERLAQLPAAALNGPKPGIERRLRALGDEL